LQDLTSSLNRLQV
jgi:hypothetical protein